MGTPRNAGRPVACLTACEGSRKIFTPDARPCSTGMVANCPDSRRICHWMAGGRGSGATSCNHGSCIQPVGCEELQAAAPRASPRTPEVFAAKCGWKGGETVIRCRGGHICGVSSGSYAEWPRNAHCADRRQAGNEFSPSGIGGPARGKGPTDRRVAGPATVPFAARPGCRADPQLPVRDPYTRPGRAFRRLHRADSARWPYPCRIAVKVFALRGAICETMPVQLVTLFLPV